MEILRDISVPQKFFNRTRFGVQTLDEIFGGKDMPGVLPGCSILFTGSPGAGKSTMALQLADLLQKNAGRKVVYNIGEENKHMIKMRADRLKVSGDFSLSACEEVDELIRSCRESKVEVLFQDSIQTLQDHDLHGDSKLRSIVKKLHNFAHSDDVTVFAIGHVTKSGRFSGPNSLEHIVDASANLKLDKETGNRFFMFDKNRFGPSGVPYEFSLSSSGLCFQPTEKEKTAPKTTGIKAQRRDAVMSFIKLKLLEGETISAYCSTRFGMECSGSFWRLMLSEAVQELQNEGYTVEEETVDRRANFHVKGK